MVLSILYKNITYQTLTQRREEIQSPLDFHIKFAPINLSFAIQFKYVSPRVYNRNNENEYTLTNNEFSLFLQLDVNDILKVLLTHTKLCNSFKLIS